jgi:hypothetical protein
MGGGDIVLTSLYRIVLLFVYSIYHSRSEHNPAFQVQCRERDHAEQKELELNLERERSWLPGVVYSIL